VAAQGAPIGSQAALHTSAPLEVGTQRCEQHCSETAHATPSERQLPGRSRQRITPSTPTRQALAPPLQQTAPCMHCSPVGRQPGAAMQRAMPSGVVLQLPEQQLAATAQRAPVGAQPLTSAQRLVPLSSALHAPVQQSGPPLQSSPVTRHPPSFWQNGTPAWAALQMPSQQSSAWSQSSPSTRQPGSAAQCSLPAAPVHALEQQSPPVLQLSPAT
jgi:hypothetical protein